MIPRLKLILPSLFLALAYFTTGRLGLMLPAFGSTITLIWMPTGIAVAALFRYGYGCWPGIALGAVAVNMAVGVPLPATLGMAAGNTCGTVLAVWALRRVGFHPAFDRPRDILFLAVTAFFGMVICASVGVTSLTLSGALRAGHLAAWLTWWAGDAMGVIIAAPLVFAITRKEAAAILLRRAEFVVWVCLTALAAWGVFVLNRGSDGQAWALAFVPLPMVSWAALRYGPIGTSVALIVISVIAAFGTATGHGPFYRSQPIEGVVVLWVYMATSATLGWVITAVHAARVQATGVQELFERALSDVSLGVLLSGLDRRITYANQGFTRLTGYTEAELLGKSCALLQGPETTPGTGEKLKAAVHGDGFFDGEILNYRKDGTTFWNALLISPVHDERGVTTGFLGIQRDITKRKKAELALHQSEEHLRQIIEIEPECVKILSPEGTLLEMNPAGLAMIEATSLEQVRGCLLGDLIVPEHRADFAEMHERAMAGGTGRCEFAIKTLKGTPRWLETHAVPYRNGQREIVGVLGITRDVTERKVAATELERSLATLQLFIDTVPAYISFVDTDERYALVNRGYEEYFGQPASQIVGQRVCDVQPPAAYAEIQPHVRSALGGQTVRYQSNRTGPTGKSYWLDVQYVPRRGEGGAVTGFFVLVFDITVNKQAELRLQESESRFRLIIENAPEAIMLLDVASGRLVQVNAAAERLFKRTAVELALIGPGELSPATQPDGRASAEKAAEYVSRALAGETPLFEWMHRDAEGRDIPCEVRLLRIEIEGRVVLRGSTTDITERKTAEEALREHEERLRAAMAASGAGTFRWDIRSNELNCDEALDALFGLRPQETIRSLENFIATVHPDDRAGTLERCERCAQDGADFAMEFRVIWPDRSVHWLDDRGKVFFDAAGLPSHMTDACVDITERKRAEDEREQLDRKVQETQKLESLGVLAGGIAHDFNNLLTTILGNASLAEMELPPGSPTQECLTQITEASLRAADLCKQMLAYSGRGRFVVQKIDLGELVEQTAQMLQISISKKAVLRFRLEKGMPPVEVDATQIRQVIMNLVINASEAIGDKSGVISLSTGLTRVDRAYFAGTLMDPDLPEGEYVFLEVSDSGSGMSAETQAKIFDPFFTTKFTGRGLGLAAVLGIVRGHKGAMKVYSEVGRGTTFKLLFPAASGVGEISVSRPPAAEAWRSEGTVLVVDDEETMRSTVARMLRHFGIEPVLVSDGREAVEVFRADPKRFALVLLDLTMPHMDGEQTFTELRRILPAVRVVLMSGFNAQEAMVRFTGKGLASFLQKPFRFEALRSVLQSVMG